MSTINCVHIEVLFVGLNEPTGSLFVLYLNLKSANLKLFHSPGENDPFVGTGNTDWVLKKEVVSAHLHSSGLPHLPPGKLGRARIAAEPKGCLKAPSIALAVSSIRLMCDDKVPLRHLHLTFSP